MEANEEAAQDIHLPRLLSPPRRVVEQEFEQGLRPIPPPPGGVNNDELIRPHTKPGSLAEMVYDPIAQANQDPSEPYIRHGSLLVSRAGEAQFEKAERYLSKDPEAMNVLYKLEHDTFDHRLDLTARMGEDRENGPDIIWNPHNATRDLEGHTTSPALALLHEEAHAIEDPKIRNDLSNTPTGDKWDDLEEKRVIMGIEKRAAEILHEGVRTSHESPDVGGNFWVDSVTSRADHPQRKPQDRGR